MSSAPSVDYFCLLPLNCACVLLAAQLADSDTQQPACSSSAKQATQQLTDGLMNWKTNFFFPDVEKTKLENLLPPWPRRNHFPTTADLGLGGRRSDLRPEGSYIHAENRNLLSSFHAADSPTLRSEDIAFLLAFLV